MTSIRLDPDIESAIVRIGARKGLTKSACIRLALERFIAAEQTAEPYALLEEVRARYRVTGSGESERSERHSEILKATLRGKHRD